MIWDDKAPVRFLENFHKKFKNPSKWQTQHKNTIKNLVYLDVPIEYLVVLRKVKIYKNRLAYWQKQYDQGKMGTLYVKVIRSGKLKHTKYRILDGHHRYKILAANGVELVQVALDRRVQSALQEVPINGSIYWLNIDSVVEKAHKDLQDWRARNDLEPWDFGHDKSSNMRTL